jgi:hypothetical protein
MLWAATVAMAITGGVLVGLFGELITGTRFFAFRDSLHFFPPLYRLVTSEWLRGSVPLWNPFLNGGQPLAAMGTPGAFYPPQLVLTCLLPEGLSLNVLMILHLFIAGAAAFFIARDREASFYAAMMAALCFALSGCVLFHVYAPNALTGAAWAAWAVRAGSLLVTRFALRDFLGLAMALALAVLSGDPQSAFHAGLVIAFLMCCRLMLGDERTDGFRSLLSRGGVLAAAAGCAALLSLVQVTLTRELMLTTTRYADVVPISIWDIPGFLLSAAPAERSQWYSALIGCPPPGLGFYHEIYRFSAAPWWFLECLSPTLGGKCLNRWPLQQGWEGQAWVATLYAGMVPLASVVVAMITPSVRRQVRGWLALLMASYVAAVGGFGAIGLARHVVSRATGAADVAFYLPGDEVGGLYWIMATCLPGYSGFRYPAKWLAIFALAFSQVAAHGFDALLGDASHRKRLAPLLGGLASVALVATACAMAYAGQTQSFVLAGGVLAGTVAATAICIVGLRMRGAITDSVCALLLLGVTVGDLVIAGRCHLFTAPFSALVEGGNILDTLRQARLPTLANGNGTPRLAALDDLIRLPYTESVVQRASWTAMAMRTHTPLLYGWGKVGEPGTAMESDTELFFLAPRPYGEESVFARRMFDSAAVEFFVVPRERSQQFRLREFERAWSTPQLQGKDNNPVPSGATMISQGPQADWNDEESSFVAYIRNESAMPRARIARRVAVASAAGQGGWTTPSAFMADIAFPNPKIPELQEVAVVESGTAIIVPDRSSKTDPWRGEAVGIVVDEPRRVVVKARLADTGLVVLADAFHPDWRLQVSTDENPFHDQDILRVNRVHRGCVLGPGQHILEFTHRSTTFDWTWPITVAGWAIVAVTWPYTFLTSPKSRSHSARSSR